MTEAAVDDRIRQDGRDTVPIRKGPHGATFYQRHGDWLSWGSVVVCLGLLVAQLLAQWMERKKGSASAGVPVK